MLIPQKEDDKHEAKKDWKIKGSVSAAILAGALSQVPETLAQEKIESRESGKPTTVQIENTNQNRPNIEGTVPVYSRENSRGKSVSMDAPIESELERSWAKAAEVRKESFVMPAEAKANARIKSAKESWRTQEVLEATRARLNGALQRMTSGTGSSPDVAIQGLGGIIVDGVISHADSKLSSVLRKKIIEEMPETESKMLDFSMSDRNAENMLITKELGGSKNWKLTVGADPDIGFGGKSKPKVGVTFRMTLP